MDVSIDSFYCVCCKKETTFSVINRNVIQRHPDFADEMDHFYCTECGYISHEVGGLVMEHVLDVIGTEADSVTDDDESLIIGKADEIVNSLVLETSFEKPVCQWAYDLLEKNKLITTTRVEVKKYSIEEIYNFIITLYEHDF